jgi:hypothetical protein
VLNYQETVEKIIIFLGETKESHRFPKKYFIPEISKKNLGIWKNYSDQDAIGTITNQLQKYCVNI